MPLDFSLPYFFNLQSFNYMKIKKKMLFKLFQALPVIT